MAFNRFSAGLFAALLALTPLFAGAEFLDPDWSELTIDGVAAPDWIAGVREGNYIGMCTGCDQMVMLEVKVLPDDGTGARVHSGETTADTYTELGEANAARLGPPSDYFGTEPIDFATAKGFRTAAQTATDDYAVSYQLWSDGRQLLVRVFGGDNAKVDRFAKAAYSAAAPLTFR